MAMYAFRLFWSVLTFRSPCKSLWYRFPYETRLRSKTISSRQLANSIQLLENKVSRGSGQLSEIQSALRTHNFLWRHSTVSLWTVRTFGCSSGTFTSEGETSRWDQWLTQWWRTMWRSPSMLNLIFFIMRIYIFNFCLLSTGISWG